MNRIPNMPFPVFILIAGCLLMILAPTSTSAQCPLIGAFGFEGINSVEGLPFQAKQVMTKVTTGNDGAKRTEVMKSHVFRDTKGRVRIERFYDGTEDPLEGVPWQIIIHDNCGTSVSLLPSQQTAKIQKMLTHLKRSDLPHCKEFDPNQLPQPGAKGKFEILGHRMLDGVEIMGWRTTYYSSIEAMSSGAPPVEITERWCSTTLDAEMDTFILSQNPKMEIRIVVTDLKRIEPDPALFEIPEGYKITVADESAKPNVRANTVGGCPRPMFPIPTVSSADNSSAASPRTSGSSSHFCRDLV